MISNILEARGPTVRVVILRTDGTVDERLVDMSPSARPMESVLGGPITFNGQYIDEMVIIVRRQRHGIINTHILPPPFHNDTIRGDICLVRMDETATPQDYTREEYNRLRNEHFITRNTVYRHRSKSI